MATIPTASHDAYLNSARRIYVASRAYNNDFFKYTVTQPSPANNFATTGALSVVTTDAAQTPAGRTLRENGKKLYPGANPGVGAYMVGVYDDQNGLSGFINPNSAVFAIYNTDKPTYLPDGSEVNGGTFSGQTEGNAVYTLGDVVAGAQIRSSTNTALTSITANGAATAQTINANLGQTFSLTCSPPSGVASITLNGTPGPVGSLVRLIVTATTAFNTTITFGTNFIKSATLVVTAAAGPVTQSYVITFISNGTSLYETGRTAALT